MPVCQPSLPNRAAHARRAVAAAALAALARTPHSWAPSKRIHQPNTHTSAAHAADGPVYRGVITTSPLVTHVSTGRRISSSWCTTTPSRSTAPASSPASARTLTRRYCHAALRRPTAQASAPLRAAPSCWSAPRACQVGKRSLVTVLPAAFPGRTGRPTRGRDKACRMGA